MKAEHLEILVEESSMEAFLIEALPKILAEGITFRIHAHQGKTDILRKLRSRLRGYARWLPETARIVVLLDRDDDNCILLKKRMEDDASAAGLVTRAGCKGKPWQIVTRIAVED